MSALSITAIDRLIEPAPGGSSTRSGAMEREGVPSIDRKPPFSFYPPLYVTPPVPQRPPSPSPSSLSPSPYVLNYKRRPPVVQKADLGSRAVTEKDSCDSEREIESSSSSCRPETRTDTSEWKLIQATASSPDITARVEQNGLVSNWSDEMEPDAVGPLGESEVFEIEIAPGERCVLASETKGLSESGEILQTTPRREPRSGTPLLQADSNQMSSSTLSLTSEEFYDAPEAPLYDSASEDEGVLPRTHNKLFQVKSSELYAARLQEEVRKRVSAEEALALLQLRWNEMARKCASIGVSISPSPCQGGAIQSEQVAADPSEILAEKLVVARLVGGAVASAAVRAIKDEEIESILTMKNREISRLWDKLQYYELVNHEMSQRNQEAIESSQRRKRRRRKRQRWVLGCFCAVLCAGTAGLICYKVFPWEQTRMWVKSLGEPVQSESDQLT